MERTVAQIMTCIDDINENKFEINVTLFIKGTTSKQEFIDSSMRKSGRLNVEVEIHIGFPMMKSIIKKNQISPKIIFSEIAKKIPGYLAPNLQTLYRAERHNAIIRLIKNNTENMEDKNENIKNLYIK